MIRALPLHQGWKFRRLEANGYPTEPWSSVELPHTAMLIDVDGRQPWLGECEYQAIIPAPPATYSVGRYALWIGAAMHTTRVFVDGLEIARNVCGYLPFEVDLTPHFRGGESRVLTLRLDNRENADVPPGKPLSDLDFHWHSGLYRGAELRVYPKIYFTDAVAADMPASGGIFARTLEASTEAATVRVKAHFCNGSAAATAVRVSVEMLHKEAVVAQRVGAPVALSAGESTDVELDLRVLEPALWSPDQPQLHTVRVRLQSNEGAILDERAERFGIRRISFSRQNGFVINGRRLRLRGVNRHQEYPYVGYAVPTAAHRRDARRIKEAGFDYVRLSHYPQSTEFLDACDELGIVVMNCLPGWQYLGAETFRRACFANARRMIRRDRNHACVVLWELSLNETQMDDAFMAELHAIGHEEYPGDQMFTCGWMDRYDVYIHSRQHGRLHQWENGDKALVVAEYGDWEFYASNAGFDQKTGAGIFAEWSHGRKLRASGERGLRQQVDNHILALNDTMSSCAVFDGLWSMFDYTRGYDLRRAACGIMDVFRLPKFSYYFYRSQRDAAAAGPGWTGGPMVFIASHWTPSSQLRILVFSNCEQVELRLNGEVIGRKGPDQAWMTQFLPHPPFVFELDAFRSGTLDAHGLIRGEVVASHRVSTPSNPVRLKLQIDDLGIFPDSDEPDLLLAHASLVDTAGALAVDANAAVRFSIVGDAKIVGPFAINAEAGVASIVLQLPSGAREFQLTADCPDETLTTTIRWRTPAAQSSAVAAG